jgi:hypothetical protein
LVVFVYFDNPFLGAQSHEFRAPRARGRTSACGGTLKAE